MLFIQQKRSCFGLQITQHTETPMTGMSTDVSWNFFEKTKDLTSATAHTIQFFSYH